MLCGSICGGVCVVGNAWPAQLRFNRLRRRFSRKFFVSKILPLSLLNRKILRDFRAKLVIPEIRGGRGYLAAVADRNVRATRAAVYRRRVLDRNSVLGQFPGGAELAGGDGEAHDESGSAVAPVVTGDLALVVLDHAIGRTQAESRAFADRLGGIERIEHTLRLADAGSGIGKLEDDFILHSSGRD